MFYRWHKFVSRWFDISSSCSYVRSLSINWTSKKHCKLWLASVLINKTTKSWNVSDVYHPKCIIRDNNAHLHLTSAPNDEWCQIQTLFVFKNNRLAIFGVFGILNSQKQTPIDSNTAANHQFEHSIMWLWWLLVKIRFLLHQMPEQSSWHFYPIK